MRTMGTGPERDGEQADRGGKGHAFPWPPWGGIALANPGTHNIALTRRRDLRDDLRARTGRRRFDGRRGGDARSAGGASTLAATSNG